MFCIQHAVEIGPEIEQFSLWVGNAPSVPSWTCTKSGFQETAVCTCLPETTWIVEAMLPEKSVCSGHVWCPRLCRICCTRAVAMWNQLSAAAGGAEWELHLRAGESERERETRLESGEGWKKETWWAKRLGLENCLGEGSRIKESGWDLDCGDGDCVYVMVWSPPPGHQSAIHLA